MCSSPAPPPASAGPTAALLAERGRRGVFPGWRAMRLHCLEAGGCDWSARGGKPPPTGLRRCRRSPSPWVAAIDAAEARFRPDRLFVCQRGGREAHSLPWEAYDEQTFETVIRTNLTSGVLGDESASLPGMIERPARQYSGDRKPRERTRACPNNGGLRGLQNMACWAWLALAAAEAAPHNVRRQLRAAGASLKHRC